MRIVCQKCAAAYAIDDRLISPKGVRAQCPRCRNLQLVKKDPSAAPPEASASEPAPQPSAADDSSLFDFGSPPPGAPSSPEENAAAPDSGGDPLFDFLGPPPAAPETSDPAPSPAPAARRPSRPVPSVESAASRPAPAAAPSMARQPTSPGVAPSAARQPSPGGATPANEAAPVATSGCRECGKPLTDPFDQALGICDSCRARVEGPPAGARPSGSPRIEPPPGSAPAVDVIPEPRSGVRTVPRSYVAQQPMVVRSAQRQGGKGALIGGLAAVLLLLGGGGGAYYFLRVKPEKEAVASKLPSGPAPLPTAVQEVVSRWQLKFLDITGTSAELSAQGTALLKKDERSAYAEAEESFQEALLQDPRNDAAIAGFVQALSLGRGTSMDDATFQEAQGLIEAAEERAGRTPRMLLAHANLLLVRPRQPQNLEKARQLAEGALNTGSDAEKAEAHLVLGRAYLSTSMGLANQHFDDALKLDAGLRQVHYFRALAYESVGQYAQALDALKKRLALDPQHWDSAQAIGRIYQELGEPGQARKLYQERLEAQPKDFHAQLALAALRYESEDNAAGAVKELRALLKNRESFANREVAEALVQLAIAERLAGSAEAAAKAADEALGLDKNLPAAHLQLLFVELGHKNAAKAREHLTAVKGQLEDAALEKVLEGRVLLVEGKPSEAKARFQEALQLDDRRHDALLLAGVAAAREKQRDEAFRFLFQALESDPTHLAPHPVSTPLYLRTSDTLMGLDGAIAALAEDPEEDMVPRLYEGLLRFHQGELGAAEKLFKQVTAVDEDNAGATSYLTLIALQRGNKPAAKALGERAVAAGRQAPIAHLVHALTLMESKQVEPAKRALRDTLALAPKLLAAEVKLAELEASSDVNSARTRLTKVLGLDPSYNSAKRLLFLLDQRG